MASCMKAVELRDLLKDAGVKIAVKSKRDDMTRRSPNALQSSRRHERVRSLIQCRGRHTSRKLERQA